MFEASFISIHPRFLESYFSFGVFRSAVEQKLAKLNIVNLRDFAIDNRGSVDDRPWGGGDGMVMRPEPLRDAILSLGSKKPRVILTSPGGTPFTHAKALELAQSTEPLAIICGRFGGVDQRFIDRYVDDNISLGEFVVSGGELPALMIVDAALRQIPGVLGDSESARIDSFAEGLDGGIEFPLYTRPDEFEGISVPDVLKSGDHAKIAAWRRAHTKRKT